MKIDVNINIDFLWGNKNFAKDEWGPITYVVGPNGTGKSIFAEKLKEELKKALKVRYFSAERLSNLGNKWDNQGYLHHDNFENGLNIGFFNNYKIRADELGQSIDALVELRNKLDLQIKIESILSDIFGKMITFQETGGYLNILVSDSGKTYDLRKNESHGLKEIITLLTFLYDDEYNCIILDEPELHLHPQFQQYILQEIKKVAGNPIENKNKKMFVILTHSPYMLSIQNSNELKDLIVFHRHEVPTYIENYEDADDYYIDRLEKLLFRMNVNHKTLFFADRPVFVEGYTDQQFYNLLQYKRDIPLGAEGITIIDVGGKDEVDIMYKLCQLLNINACCIVDMDALFEGRIRQTASKNEQTTKFLVIKGKDTLDKEIGKLERLLDEIANELVQLQNDLALKGEMKHLLDLLEELTEKNKKTMYRKVLFLGLHRIGQEIKKVISSDNQTKLMKINGLAKDIFECFESINIFILEKGEIENYYLTPINDHYQIPDNKKTEYFLQENQRIDDMKKTEIENNYKDIINILDKVCFLTSVNTTKFVCAKIGDWIHNVQSLVKIEPNISEDVLINNPKADWDNFKRIIKIEEFQANNGKLSCKFRIINDLVPDSHEYSFSEDTVAANFQV